MSDRSGFYWSEWRRGDRAVVSGWDPVSYILFVPCLLGLLFVHSEGWGAGAIAVGVTVLAGLTCRYYLVITPDGYRLWRTCIGIPWYVRRFSSEAFVYVEDDDGEDVGLAISEPSKQTFEESMRNRRRPIVFGTTADCHIIVHRIQTLAFQLGCSPTPPGDDPAVIKVDQPRQPRRHGKST